MNAKTRIFVVKMREVIYTAILACFVILLVILLFMMFLSKTADNQAPSSSSQKTTEKTEAAIYTPGVYTTPVTLGSSVVDVEVTVDSDHINAIRLVNLNESVSAMYPLVSSAIKQLSEQICRTQSLDSLTGSSESQYTARLLLNAVAQSLEQAKGTTSENAVPS